MDDRNGRDMRWDEMGMGLGMTRIAGCVEGGPACSWFASLFSLVGGEVWGGSGGGKDRAGRAGQGRVVQ